MWNRREEKYQCASLTVKLKTLEQVLVVRVNMHSDLPRTSLIHVCAPSLVISSGTGHILPGSMRNYVLTLIMDGKIKSILQCGSW